MSKPQRSLADYQPDRSRTADVSQWQPSGAANQRECQRCGAHVSRAYWRCYSVDGVLHCCKNCEDVTRGSDGRAREARSHTTRTTAPTEFEEGGGR